MDAANGGAAGLSRRRVLGWAAAGAVLGAGGAALAGCAQGGSGGEERLNQQPARSVPLSVWSRGVSDKAVFDQITPLVEAKYPHLAITSEAVTGINDKIV